MVFLGIRCCGDALAERRELVAARRHLAEGGCGDGIFTVWQRVNSLIDQVKDSVHSLNVVPWDGLDLVLHIERRQGRIQVHGCFHKCVAIAGLLLDGWSVNPSSALAAPRTTIWMRSTSDRRAWVKPMSG